MDSTATPPRLRAIGLLASLDDGELRALEQRCRFQRHAAGAAIVDRRSEHRDVYFVVEGRVRAVAYSPTGREIVYGLIEPGGQFGELSALDGEGRSATVVALEPCLLAALPPSAFEALLLRHPRVGLALLQDMARMIRTIDRRLLDVASQGVTARLCRELRQLAVPEPDQAAWQISPLPTQKDLAALAATSRETVARVLAQLARAGVVERRGRRLRILDRAAFDRASDGRTPRGEPF